MSVPLVIALCALAASAGGLTMGLLAGAKMDAERRRAYIAGMAEGAELAQEAFTKTIERMVADGRITFGPGSLPPSDEVAQEMHRRRSL